MSLNFAYETEQETDGRWIAEIRSLPGVMVYGNTEPEAIRSVQVLALQVLADRVRQEAAAPERELVVCLARAR